MGGVATCGRAPVWVRFIISRSTGGVHDLTDFREALRDAITITLQICTRPPSVPRGVGVLSGQGINVIWEEVDVVNIFDDLKYSVSEWRRALVVGGSCEDPRRLLMTLDDVTMVLMTDSVVVQLCFLCEGADALVEGSCAL